MYYLKSVFPVPDPECNQMHFISPWFTISAIGHDYIFTFDSPFIDIKKIRRRPPQSVRTPEKRILKHRPDFSLYIRNFRTVWNDEADTRVWLCEIKQKHFVFALSIHHILRT